MRRTLLQRLSPLLSPIGARATAPLGATVAVRQGGQRTYATRTYPVAYADKDSLVRLEQSVRAEMAPSDARLLTTAFVLCDALGRELATPAALERLLRTSRAAPTLVYKVKEGVPAPAARVLAAAPPLRIEAKIAPARAAPLSGEQTLARRVASIRTEVASSLGPTVATMAYQGMPNADAIKAEAHRVLSAQVNTLAALGARLPVALANQLALDLTTTLARTDPKVLTVANGARLFSTRIDEAPVWQQLGCFLGGFHAPGLLPWCTDDSDDGTGETGDYLPAPLFPLTINVVSSSPGVVEPRPTSSLRSDAPSAFSELDEVDGELARLGFQWHDASAYTAEAIGDEQAIGETAHHRRMRHRRRREREALEAAKAAKALQVGCDACDACGGVRIGCAACGGGHASHTSYVKGCRECAKAASMGAEFRPLGNALTVTTLGDPIGDISRLTRFTVYNQIDGKTVSVSIDDKDPESIETFASRLFRLEPDSNHHVAVRTEDGVLWTSDHYFAGRDDHEIYLRSNHAYAIQPTRKNWAHFTVRNNITTTPPTSITVKTDSAGDALVEQGKTATFVLRPGPHLVSIERSGRPDSWRQSWFAENGTSEVVMTNEHIRSAIAGGASIGAQVLGDERSGSVVLRVHNDFLSFPPKALEVAIDGGAPVTIPQSHGRAFRLAPGPHRVSYTAGGRVLRDDTVDFASSNSYLMRVSAINDNGLVTTAPIYLVHEAIPIRGEMALGDEAAIGDERSDTVLFRVVNDFPDEPVEVMIDSSILWPITLGTPREFRLAPGSHQVVCVTEKYRQRMSENMSFVQHSTVSDDTTNFEFGKVYTLRVAPRTRGYGRLFFTSDLKKAEATYTIKELDESIEAPLAAQMRAIVPSGFSATVVSADGSEQALGADLTPVAPGAKKIVLTSASGSRKPLGAPLLLMAGQSCAIVAERTGANGELRCATRIEADAGAALAARFSAATAAPAPGLLIVHADGATTTAQVGAFATANGEEHEVKTAGGKSYIFDADRCVVFDDANRPHRVLAVGAHPAAPGTTIVLVPTATMPLSD